MTRFLVTQYGSTVNRRFIKKVLTKHGHILKAVHRDLRVGLSHSVQKNLFRKHYGDNWCYAGSKGR